MARDASMVEEEEDEEEEAMLLFPDVECEFKGWKSMAWIWVLRKAASAEYSYSLLTIFLFP
jgi:hypothetical protein